MTTPATEPTTVISFRVLESEKILLEQVAAQYGLPSLAALLQLLVRQGLQQPDAVYWDAWRIGFYQGHTQWMSGAKALLDQQVLQAETARRAAATNPIPPTGWAPPDMAGWPPVDG